LFIITPVVHILDQKVYWDAPGRLSVRLSVAFFVCKYDLYGSTLRTYVVGLIVKKNFFWKRKVGSKVTSKSENTPNEANFTCEYVQDEAKPMLEIKFMKLKFFSQKGSKTLKNQNLQIIWFKMKQSQFSK